MTITDDRRICLLCDKLFYSSDDLEILCNKCKIINKENYDKIIKETIHQNNKMEKQNDNKKG
jgi:phage FluMu protein Com